MKRLLDEMSKNTTNNSGGANICTYTHMQIMHGKKFILHINA
jgi:hypothetical protein